MVGRRVGIVAGVALLSSSSARADFNLPDPDVTPPIVTIVAPVDGIQLDAPATVDVAIEASDPLGPGRDYAAGISAVWLEVDGVAVTPMRAETYAYSLELDVAGTYELRAHAVDFDGNSAQSQIVRVNIAGATDTSAANESSGGGTGDSSSGGAGTNGTNGTNGDGSSGASPSDDPTTSRGCACTLDHDAPYFAWALLALTLRRRRAKTVSSRAR
ncbi:MAG TPA: Ig-like domain-containing protein [Nannocystaceae bacterium]|nr:Ig-like domain-containing protein [Nannocystaceae bacterium]